MHILPSSHKHPVSDKVHSLLGLEEGTDTIQQIIRNKTASCFVHLIPDVALQASVNVRPVRSHHVRVEACSKSGGEGGSIKVGVLFTK